MRKFSKLVALAMAIVMVAALALTGPSGRDALRPAAQALLLGCGKRGRLVHGNLLCLPGPFGCPGSYRLSL